MDQTTYRILLAEDDPNLGHVLQDSLEMDGHDVDLYEDGDAAWTNFNKEAYDICILDIMMPVKDGFTLAREIRSVAPAMPVIFLTAKSMKEDKIEGLRIGADDYITKPFSMEELTLRVDAVMRRVHSAHEPDENKVEYRVGSYVYDDRTRMLTHGDTERKLTTKEAELFKMLAHHKNKLLEREIALKSIWGNDSYFTGRSMDVYITKLRKYLAEDPRIQITNIHGKGFKLQVIDE